MLRGSDVYTLRCLFDQRLKGLYDLRFRCVYD